MPGMQRSEIVDGGEMRGRVQVGDRYADMWGCFTTCAQQGCDFLVRAAQDRRVQQEDGTSYLFTALPDLPVLGQHARGARGDVDPRPLLDHRGTAERLAGLHTRRTAGLEHVVSELEAGPDPAGGVRRAAHLTL
jgi:hypothetical protein